MPFFGFSNKLSAKKRKGTFGDKENEWTVGGINQRPDEVELTSSQHNPSSLGLQINRVETLADEDENDDIQPLGVMSDQGLGPGEDFAHVHDGEGRVRSSSAMTRSRGFTIESVTAASIKDEYTRRVTIDKGRERAISSASEVHINDDSRKCTDCIWLGLFCLFWIGMFIIAYFAVSTGEPERLLYATNSEGVTCGTGNYQNRSHIYYPNMMNDLVLAYTSTKWGKNYNPAQGGDPTKIRFFGVCVESCPEAGAVVHGFRVPLDTANVLFRCLPYNNVTTVYTTRCLETTGDPDYGAKGSTLFKCYSSNNCKSVINDKVPSCTKAEVERQTVTQRLARSNPVVDILAETGATVNRMFGDMVLATPAILLCGGIGTMLFSFLYMIFVGMFVKTMVWGTVWLAWLLLVSLTLVLMNWGGVLESTDPRILVLEKVTNAPISRDADSVGDASSGYGEVSMFAEYETKTYMYLSYIFLGLSVLTFLAILFMRRRIGLAIGIIRLTAKAVKAQPLLIVFPVVPCMAGVLLMVYWLYVAAHIASAGDIVSDAASTQLASLDSRVNGTIIKFFDGEAGRYRAMGYHFFGLLWTKQFIYAIGVMTISGAVADYYWCRDKKYVSSCKIVESFWWTIRYHLGSVSLGSLVLAFLDLLKMVMTYIDKKTKEIQRRCRLLACLMCMLKWCMFCVDKCLRFVSRSAFIVVSITGTNFCVSSHKAVQLIRAYALEIGFVSFVAHFVLQLGKIACVAISLMTMLRMMNDPLSILPHGTPIPLVGALDEATAKVAQVSSPTLPLVATLVLSYAIASYCFSVYQMAIDTILLCFCEDLEVNRVANEYFATDELLNYIGSTAKKYALLEAAEIDGMDGNFSDDDDDQQLKINAEKGVAGTPHVASSTSNLAPSSMTFMCCCMHSSAPPQPKDAPLKDLDAVSHAATGNSNDFDQKQTEI